MLMIAAGVDREHVEAFWTTWASRGCEYVATWYRGLEQFFKWSIRKARILRRPCGT